MMRMAFRRGLSFYAGAKRFVLERRLVNRKFRFEDQDGGTLDLNEIEVHRRWMDGAWHVDEASLGIASDVYVTTTPSLLADYDQNDQNIARHREQYVLRIERQLKERGERFVSSPEKLGPLIAMTAQELKDMSPPCADTVWRWWKLYSPTRCATRLVDRQRTGRPTLLNSFSGLFDEAVEEIYLNAQKLPGRDVVERLNEKVVAFMNRPGFRGGSNS